MMETNYFGLPIISPEYFEGEHVANPTTAGLPPVCSCGWTPHGQFQMSDHLAEMKNLSTHKSELPHRKETR